MIAADSFAADGIGSTQGTFLTARPRSRFTVALLLSLLVHALLLSLQFGIRGPGLPGLQLPWEERRALVPALTVRIVGANKKAGSSASPASAGSAPAPAIDKPRAEARSAPSAITVAPHGRMTLWQRTDKASSRTPPREIRKPAPASVKQTRTSAAPPRHRKPSPANPRPPIIAGKQRTPDAFTVPIAPTDDVKMREWAAEVASREAPPAAATESDDEALAKVHEKERLEQIRKAEAQTLEQENARRQALELEARKQTEQWAQRQAQELEEQNLRRERQLEASRLAEQMARQRAARQQALEQEARRQEEQAAQQQLEEDNLRAQQIDESKREEENAQRQALALEAQRQTEQLARQQAAQQLEQEHAKRQAEELQKRRQAEQIAQQQAIQQLEEENARRQAEELEARRQAEQIAEQEAARRQEEESAQHARQLKTKKLADENARREAAELAARRQGEQAAAQQAAALEGQRQADEVAAAGNAHGRTSGQDADATGTPGLVHVPGSDSTASGASGASGTSAAEPNNAPPADTDDGPFLLSDSDLASAKVAQVRKVDATRLDSRAAQELASAQDSRRRTIFGSADDDIVLKMYIDSWRQAIERGGNADHAPAQGDADVTVVIRSDGNIDSITVNRSDGSQDMEQLVRRIAQSSAQPRAFPSDLVRRYDVIEIRRVWRFGDRLTILEEGR